MQIKFNYETKYGMFCDALNLSDNHEYTEQEILLMQEQRRDNWIAYIDNSHLETPLEPITETTLDIPSDTTSETPSEPII